MSEKYNDDYESANKALISREAQKLERAKARAEALQDNMSKGLAAALKASRQNIVKEAGRAVSRGENGSLSPVEQKMLDAARQGIDRVQIEEGIITGMEPYLNRHDDDDDV